MDDDLLLEVFESVADPESQPLIATSNLLSVNQLLESVSLHYLMSILLCLTLK